MRFAAGLRHENAPDSPGNQSPGTPAVHPDLIDIGFLHLKTYGACMAVGFFVCSWLVERLSGRKDISGLLMLLAILGIAGARCAYVIENWQTQFAADPWQILRVDRGGLVFYGGLIAAIAGYFAWCIVKRESFTALSDHMCTVVPLGHAFGRIGCFFFGCCYGRRSECALAVHFPVHSPAWYAQLEAGEIAPDAPHALGVLPTQLVEAAALLAIFALLAVLYARLKDRRGFLTGLYLALYALVRFGIEYLRGDPRAEVGPLSIAQTISVCMFALGAFFIFRAARRARAESL